MNMTLRMFSYRMLRRIWTPQSFQRLLIAVACCALFITFRTGLVRGFQDIIGTESWGRVLYGIGSAITQIDHGGYGYTIADGVEARLQLGGLTGNADILSKLGTKFPDNLHNSTLINHAIDDARTVKWPFNPATGVRGAGSDDIGFADYVKMGFYLFGHNLLALYLTYFVILGISVAAFISVFRHQLEKLAIFAISCIALACLFDSSILNPENLGSITDPRFLSTLCIIPTLHIAFVIGDRSPPFALNIVGIVIQSAILVFMFSIRASVVWALFAILVFWAIWSVRDVRTMKRLTSWGWVIGILLVVIGLHAFYVFQVLHPVYKQKGENTSHALWHALFYQLQFHPKWNEKYSAAYDHAKLDELPPIAAKKYLLRHPPPDPEVVYLTSDRQYLKSTANETYVRKAFFEFLANDPKFVFETIALYNPRSIGRILFEFLTSLMRNATTYAIGSLAILIIVAGLIASRHAQLARFRQGALLVTGGFALSLLPNVLTVQRLIVMADPCYLLLVTLGTWFTYLCAEAICLSANRTNARSCQSRRNPVRLFFQER